MERLAVVLIETREPGNLGAVARVMKNHGARELVLVNPACDPLDGLARAMAAGAGELLRRARRCATLAEALAPYELTVALTGVAGHQRQLECAGATPAPLLEGHAEAPRLALVFGREDHGMSNEEANVCAHRWRLPTAEDFPSLNLAQAVGIALAGAAEAYRARGWDAPSPAGGLSPRSLHPVAGGDSRDRFATQGEIDGVLEHLRDAMHRLGYDNSARTQTSLALLRSMATRSRLTQRESQILRGLIAQTLWLDRRLRKAEGRVEDPG
ncbi:MAG: TrmH family RNA methyltransferase [Candidatus Sumerlaeia bacterium]|nr:TrmH family RNA methyltransferase [Candidatus Sumerlaeia bacterium]